MRSRSRRQFTKTLAMGLAAASVGDVASRLLTSADGDGALHAQKRARRLKVGHTGITWGFKPTDAEGAIKDVAALGYHGYESFGGVLEYWEQQGGFDAKLKAVNLPLQSAYCPINLTDPTKRKDEVAKIVRWGGLIKKCGGSVAVLGPNNVKRPAFDFAKEKADDRRGAERDRQSARRHRRRRRAAPAHRHVRGNARRNLRGDGSGGHALRQVRAGCRSAAEGRRRIR